MRYAAHTPVICALRVKRHNTTLHKPILWDVLVVTITLPKCQCYEKQGNFFIFINLCLHKMLTLEKAAYTGSTMYYPCKSSVIFKIISEKKKERKKTPFVRTSSCSGKTDGQITDLLHNSMLRFL